MEEGKGVSKLSQRYIRTWSEILSDKVFSQEMEQVLDGQGSFTEMDALMTRELAS